MMGRLNLAVAAPALFLWGSHSFVWSAEPLEAHAGKPVALVRYAQFGARGDSVADDFDAIAKAHAFANEHGLPVRAEDGATYYIGGQKKEPISIQTDTDFGSAKFVIDDTDTFENRGNLFQVRSKLKPGNLQGITSLQRNQPRIVASLPGSCVVTVVNSRVKHFIRFGANQNNGSPQTDVFIVDRDGNVDATTPVIWDFDQITRISAQPIDPTTVTITGGRFTTVANAAESKYTYYGRGIEVQRSRVVIDGLEHRITGEGDHGAPYSGFIQINNCAYVTVRNCRLSGHRTYQTIGSAGKPVSMGSYDLTANRALNVSFVNCRQINDIKDRDCWGIFASNFCKNLVLDNCVLSRFDAHQGVANASIRNCTLGHAGINAIGTGTLTIENSTVHGGSFINLRSDYGSTWRGDFIIRNCVFVPACGRPVSSCLIGGSYSGKHNFGYTCHMPEQISIDTLHIDDSNHPDHYRGPAIFANFNRQFAAASYVEEYPYIKTKRVILRNVTTASGKPLRTSDNPLMFQDVTVSR